MRPLGALAGPLLLLGCEGPAPAGPETPEPPAGAAVAAVVLDRDSALLLAGENTRLTATSLDSLGQPLADRTHQWATRNAAVARVGPSGLVEATDPGATWIVVADGARRDSARVRVGLRFASIHAGSDVTCALTAAGEAWCWGWNGFGQQGNGTEVDTALPARAAGGLTFRALVLGSGTSCGIAGQSAIWCWGYNGVGQLADGTILSRSSPALLPESLEFAVVRLGAGTTPCARTDEGRWYCWGWNRFNQLLDGTGFNQRRPTPLVTSPGLEFVTAGGGHVCGLDGAGRAWCWGRNDFGQLGDGSADDRAAPTPVTTDLAFAQLVAGETHTCGRTATGAVYCWGDNASGQVGPAGGIAAPLPVAVAPGVAFDTIAATRDHTCALWAGVGYCWGANDYGQLGGQDGSGIGIGGAYRWRTISPGTTHTCGVTTDGVAYCWGRNFYGGLGIGSYVDIAEPVRVAHQP